LGELSVLEGDPGAVVGSVVLADGMTPAFAAQSLLFAPGEAQPVASGVSDAAGRITCRGRWISGNPVSPGRDGQVERPSAVVRLPGQNVAVVLATAPDRLARAVLPPPLAAEGRGTFGGRPVDGRNARMRVVAAYNTTLSHKHWFELSDDLLGCQLTYRFTPQPVDHLAVHSRQRHTAAVRPRGKKAGVSDHAGAAPAADATPARPESWRPA
jgi:hypothetical protein